MNVRILSKADIEKILTVELAFDAVREAYKAHGLRQVTQPPIVSMEMPAYHGEMDIKSCYTAAGDIIGVKMLSGFWDNPKKFGLPVSMGLMCVYDGKTGAPVSILDAGNLTYYRTSAAGAFAATLLARADSESMAVIGTGGLARMHVHATLAYFAIKKVFVYGIDSEQKRQFIQDMSSAYPGTSFINCDTAEQAVRNADIIATATPANKAIIESAWVRPGTHINAFGCDMVGKQELDPEIFKKASKIVVDNVDECCRRGDTQHPIRLGLIERKDIYAEIGEIALGNKPGREAADEITIFDSTGMSIQDVATSFAIYNKALELGIGTTVDL